MGAKPDTAIAWLVGKLAVRFIQVGRVRPNGMPGASTDPRNVNAIGGPAIRFAVEILGYLEIKTKPGALRKLWERADLPLDPKLWARTSSAPAKDKVAPELSKNVPLCRAHEGA